VVVREALGAGQAVETKVGRIQVHPIALLRGTGDYHGIPYHGFYEPRYGNGMGNTVTNSQIERLGPWPRIVIYRWISGMDCKTSHTLSRSN